MHKRQALQAENVGISREDYLAGNITKQRAESTTKPFDLAARKNYRSGCQKKHKNATINLNWQFSHHVIT
jgi:hypothetical protein